ncbi:MAG TPA: Lrp/AsnC family transcriptional regulator [Anaerolineales bacterium]|jgi:Lrp/AsnC family transcriptional regulator for asnA, asnC and gidA
MENNIRTQYSNALDDADRFIIEAMRQDGRVAFAQIAQQLNVSPGMVRVRYNRMVRLGLIRVVAITNPLRMGYTTMTMIGIRTEGDKMLEVAQKVAEFEEVIYLIVVSGRFDIMAEVVCRDHADLLHFLTEKLYRVDGVRESETFVHLKIEKEVYY